MKVKRDNLGHICQINMDDGSEIPSDEIKTAFDFISDDQTKITERYKIDAFRHKNNCNFWQNIVPDIAGTITNVIINHQNQLSNNVTDADEINMQQEFDMPAFEDQ